MERIITLEATYRAERNKILGWLSRRVGDEAAEDILHDVVVRAITNFDSLEPVRDFAAWLWASAKNAVIDAWRKRGRRAAAGEADLDDFSSVVDDAWRSAAEESERAELLSALEGAVDALPQEQRDVIVAQVFYGETFKSIAERTGTSIETLAARKRYALAKLRVYLRIFPWRKTMHRFFNHDGERKFPPLAIAAFVVGGVVLMAALALFFGWIVLLLWNWLMPEIFGLPRIGYWQAWGLVLLSHILVKGGFGHGGHAHGPHGWKRGRRGAGWKDELRSHFSTEETASGTQGKSDGGPPANAENREAPSL